MPRPKPDKPSIQILLRLHPDVVAEIDKHRGEVSRAKWITGAIVSQAHEPPMLRPQKLVTKAELLKEFPNTPKRTWSLPEGNVRNWEGGEPLKVDRPVRGFDPITGAPIYREGK